MRILLIDGGYASFYRFHAAVQWWRKQDQPIDTCWQDPRFQKTVFDRYEKSIKELIKKLKPDKVILCMDGHNSWRRDLHPEYKGTRKIKRRLKKLLDFGKNLGQKLYLWIQLNTIKYLQSLAICHI